MGDIAVEWQPESGEIGISSYDISARMPTLPIFGPIPPFITTGFSFTDIDVAVGGRLASRAV